MRESSTATVSGTPARASLPYLGAATALVGSSYGMCRFGLGLTLPRVSGSLAISAGLSGTASSLAFATYCVSALAAGSLTRSGRAAFTFTLAGALGLLGAVMVSAAASPAMFAVGVPVAGAAAGFVSPGVAYGISLTAPASRKDRWQAIANSGTGLGVLLAGILTVWLPWRACWVAFGLCTAGAALASVITAARGTSRTAPAMVTENPGSFSAVVTPCVLAGGMGFGSAAFWTFGRVQAERAAGLTPTESLLFWCAVGVAGIAGAISGDVADRIGFRTAWASVSLLMGGAVAAAAGAASLPVFLGIGAIFGGAYVLLCGTQITAAAIAWPKAVGAATAVTFTSIAAGQVTGALACGWIIQLWGYSWAFTIAGAVTAVAGLAVCPTSFGKTPVPGRSRDPASGYAAGRTRRSRGNGHQAGSH